MILISIIIHQFRDELVDIDTWNGCEILQPIFQQKSKKYMYSSVCIAKKSHTIAPPPLCLSCLACYTVDLTVFYILLYCFFAFNYRCFIT